MRKLMFMIFFSVMFASSPVYECEGILDNYRINAKIKSVKGWERVINNNRLSKYAIKTIRKEDLWLLKQCVIQE